MSLQSQRPWTREEFRMMAETGVLAPDERLELLDGVIVTKMTQNARHSACTLLVSYWLQEIVPSGWTVRSQLPIALSERSEPEPDVAVVRGLIRDFIADQPGPKSVALLVEVSDSSLKEDRRIKVALYATAGIEEVWILDVNQRRLIVHQDPENGEYRLVRILHEDESISPAFAPDRSTAVRDLLP